MLRDDQGRDALTRCVHIPGQCCPREACAGRADLEVCRHLVGLATCRSQTFAQQVAGSVGGGEPEFQPAREPAGGRIRLGFWSPCLGQGGAEAWQLALARAVDPGRFAWAGTAVIEGRRSSDPVMAAELAALMPVGYGLEAARSLARACDVVISWAVVHVRELLGGMAHPPAVVMACHFPAESPWGHGTCEMLDGVDRYVAVSELALDSVHPRVRGKVELIWNAVDSSRMRIRRDRARMRATWGCPPDAMVAGFMGRLAFEKDPGAMLRLAAELPEPWHVVLVGAGHQEADLRDEVIARGLTGRVHLVGPDPAAGDVLNAFDTLVVPSRYESFGLTMAEGLWAALPVVATRSGLAKLVPGLVREVAIAASGPELAAAVLQDRSDLVNTVARVLNARAFAREHLGLDRFGQAWSDFLADVHHQKKSARPCPTTSRSTRPSVSASTASPARRTPARGR